MARYTCFTTGFILVVLCSTPSFLGCQDATPEISSIDAGWADDGTDAGLEMGYVTGPATTGGTLSSTPADGGAIGPAATVSGSSSSGKGGSSGGSSTSSSSGGSRSSSSGGSSSGGTSTSSACKPDCAHLCGGAPDGCGGFCPNQPCAGCCDAVGACVAGNANAACGTNGDACVACGANDVCAAGACVSSCAPDCTGKCGGAADGCGGFCPDQPCAGCCDGAGVCQAGIANATCGTNGDACAACGANDHCAAGACVSNCTPDCTGKCGGASDGCGGSCAVGDCAGCCDGNRVCQTGDTQAACGLNGDACVSCGSGPCEAATGTCCSRTPAPACSLVATSDGCGLNYAATCVQTATSGPMVCCGGATGQCCAAAQCCGSQCCGAGEECSPGGACCKPQCAGKCPFADDGCGGQCPVPKTGNPGCTYDGIEGCCDSNGVCQPGSTDAACGNGGACLNCGSNGESCNSGVDGGSLCCTPGKGCGYSCGSTALRDDCGNVCPVNCPYEGCCANGICYVGGNSDSACGYGGANTECQSCGGASCADPAAAAAGNYAAACGVCLDGATQSVSCNGFCGTQQQLCVNGAWVDQGACTNACAEDECCASGGNGPNYCFPFEPSNTQCGNNGGACLDCTQWANGNDQGYGICSNSAPNWLSCCLTKGAPVDQGTQASACCSGTESCGLNVITGWTCSCD